ncbi:hypothetical protein LINGRAHAP2_LOCUS16566, partial [Linum grandiflorum]
WEVRVEHIYREANFAADYLAHFGHNLPPGDIQNFSSFDSSLANWLLTNCNLLKIAWSLISSPASYQKKK